MSALVNVCVYCMSSFQLPEQIKKLTTFYGFGWFVGSVPSCVLCLVSWTMTELRSLSLALIFLTKQWIHKLNYLDATKCRMQLQLKYQQLYYYYTRTTRQVHRKSSGHNVLGFDLSPCECLCFPLLFFNFILLQLESVYGPKVRVQLSELTQRDDGNKIKQI